MPYIKRVVKAGNTIEVKKYYSARRSGTRENGIRAPKQKITREKMADVNERNALEKLTWLLNTNFGPGDMHCVLTYRQSYKPEAEESKKCIQEYLRRLRAAAKRIGTELKYIWVTEYKHTRIHHHLIVSKLDHELVSGLWEHGQVHFTGLYDSGEYSQLAAYLIKETKESFREGKASGKRWNASKNLDKPKITKTVVPAESWADEPKPLKGYYIPADLIETSFDEYGMPYQKYTMIAVREVKMNGLEKHRNRRVKRIP